MTGSRLAFPNLSYVGIGAAARLAEEVNRYGAKSILFITDPVLQKLGTVDRLAEPLRALGCSVDVFSEIMPEPTIELGERIVQYARDGKFDLVIGLGGGSAMDLAKLAAVLCAHEGPVADYLNLTGTRKIAHKGLPKLLLPTTAGTASEVTNIAVLSLAHTKDVVVHDYLGADAAIVDSSLTLSVPPRVTAATGMDAMTHAIEAYLSVLASPVTDGLALHAVRLAGRSISQAVHEGTSVEARDDMAHASYIAGLSFFNAGVAGVHALAYPLGGQFHIPHGEANAVLLPYVMAHIAPSCEKRMGDLLEALGGSKEDGAAGFVSKLHALISEVGLPATLSEYGIKESDLPMLTDDAVLQKRLLARSPLVLERSDIAAIYEAAFWGRK